MSKRKYKNEIIVENLINKMFEFAGHQVTYEDIKDRKDDWYRQWTMTEEQNKQWKDWGISYIKKSNHFIKYRAEKEMAWFDLMYGLRIQK